MDFQEKLAQSLQLNITYFPERDFGSISQLKHAQRPEIIASVIALFCEKKNIPHLLLIRRSESVLTHKGQYAFPGGKVDHSDRKSTKELTLRATALRETYEEVGIPKGSIKILGPLPPLPTLSTGYWVQPWVGWLQTDAKDALIKIDLKETAWANWVDWSEFQRKENYKIETFQTGKLTFPTHVFQIQEHRIWGATAAMIRNLLDRIKSLDGAPK